MTDNQEPENNEAFVEAGESSAGAWNDLEDGYIGNPTSRLDERGRLKMPAEFKAFTERKYGKTFNAFYITSMDGESAEIHPMPEWRERHRKISQLPQSSPVRRALMDRYSLYGARVDMDPQGRMQIPDELRTVAELTGDVRVNGEGKFLRVISLKRLRERVAANPLTPEMLDSLGDQDL